MLGRRAQSTSSPTTLSPPEADRRGPGDGAGRPRPRPRGANSLRHRRAAKCPSPKTSKSWRAERAATVIVDDLAFPTNPLPGRPGRRRDRRSHRRRGPLLLRRRQRQSLRRDGDEIASWEAPKFRDSPTVRGLLGSLAGQATDCIDFDPGSAGERHLRDHGRTGRTLIVNLQWAEPWFGVNAALDAFLTGPGGELRRLPTSPATSYPKNPSSGRVWLEKHLGTEDAVPLVIDRCLPGRNAT